MSSGKPTGQMIVLYFFLLTLAVMLFSEFSPVTPITIQEIPQSSAWGEPLVVQTVPPMVRVPQFTVDSQGTVHALFYDKVGDFFDIFSVSIKEGRVSSPQNVTEYPSLKESVSIAADSSEKMYAAFLDNRYGKWQVFLLEVDDRTVMQLTDTDTHKEDVSLRIGPHNERVVTWTELRDGVSRIFLIVLDEQGTTLVEKCISGDLPAWKASIAADELLHVMYLEKRGYDHIIYKLIDFSGNVLEERDLGEYIHLDPVSLTLLSGPQIIIGKEVICVWSDSRTGFHNLYCMRLENEARPVRLTQYPPGIWSWMPSVVERDGVIEVAYVNNGFGLRIFHSQISENLTYEELGTITSRRERATAPSLVGDDKGYVHCMYLRFRDDGKFDLVYRNTNPSAREGMFSEEVGDIRIRYLYSFALSFLFSFPLMVKDNFLGLVLLVAGFFSVRFFQLKDKLAKVRDVEYLLFVLSVGGLSVLRGFPDYSYLAPAVYEKLFIIYGFLIVFLITFLFKYLLKDRFDIETRALLWCLAFLYFLTLFFVVPIVPHI